MLTSKHEDLQNKQGTVVIVQDPEIGNATIDLINETGKQVELSVHLLGHKSRAATVEKMNDILLKKENDINAAEQDLLKLQSEGMSIADEVGQNAESLKELKSAREGLVKEREEVFASLNNNVKVNKELEDKIKGLEMRLESASAELAGKSENIRDLNAQKATVSRRMKEIETDIEGHIAALQKDDKRISVKNILPNVDALIKAIDASGISYAKAVSQTNNKEVKAQNQVKELLGLSEQDNLGKTKFVKIKTICEKIKAKDDIAVELHDIEGAIDQAIAEERVLQRKAVIAADVVTAATKEKEKADVKFKRLEVLRAQISVDIGSIEKDQLRHALAAEKLRGEQQDLELKVISKEKEIAIAKARYQAFKEQAIGVARNESGLANLVKDFSAIAEVKTGDAFEIDLAVKRNHIVVVKSQAEAEMVEKACAGKFIIERVDNTGIKKDAVGFAAQVDALNMSRIFVDHQPTFEGDKKTEATANDNKQTVSVAEKVLANSIALGEVVKDDKWSALFEGINRELARGLRAVLVRSPLVKGAEGGPLLAVFPLSTKEMASTSCFNIALYNQGKESGKEVPAQVVDDSVTIELSDKTRDAIQTWANSKATFTKMVGTVLSYGVYASR